MYPFAMTDAWIHGVKLTMLTHQEDKIIGEFIRSGQIWSGVLDYLQRAIKPWSQVLDAGGNIGTTSLFLAKLQPTATIYCFEPDPLNYSLLNINIALNHVTNIRTFNYALGRQEQFTDFYRSKINFGDHRSAKPMDHDIDAADFAGWSNRIHMVNPAHFLRQCLGERAPDRFDLVKIDTQGADFDILGACLPILSEDSIIVSEFSPYHLFRNGTSKEDVADLAEHFTGIEVINPIQDPNRTTPIGLKDLLLRYDDLHREWKSYFDIVLKNYRKNA